MCCASGWACQIFSHERLKQLHIADHNSAGRHLPVLEKLPTLLQGSLYLEALKKRQKNT
jgi:hypothetical protein